MQAGRLLAPALIACAAMAVSVHLGPDASWDLRNYHLYNAFALLNKPPGTDLVAAQLQSFLPPAPDVPGYVLRRLLNRNPGVLDALLALPTAAAAIVTYYIGLHLVAGRHRWLPALLAVAYGVTGAAGLPMIGAAGSEMPAGCLVLAALLVLLRGLDGLGARRVLAAGCLMGVAVAVKLTVAPFVIAACLATLVAMRGTAGRRAACVLWLALGGMAGGIAAGGAWWWHLYQLTGNPIFPYYNDVFRSPLSAPIAWEDNRFLPHGVLQAVLFPFYWGFQKSRVVSELVVRDPRIALAAIGLAVFAVTATVRRRVDRAGLCVALFLAVGYVVWEREFAIFRYLAPVEMLSGMALLLPLRPLLLRRPRLAGAAAFGLGVFLALFTRYPDWGHAYPARRAVAVAVPPMPAGSMVLMLGDGPMSYVAAFVDPAVRFIGVDNNFIHPGGDIAFGRRVEAAVKAQIGPLYGLIPLGAQPAHTAEVLAFYNLQRTDDCHPVSSNLDFSTLTLCRLTR